MSWEAIGAVAEAIGALGVIASLLYLATQVRSSTRASAVGAKLESTRLLNDFVENLIQKPELNDLFLRGLADPGSLSKSDYYRFSNMALKAFWFFSAGYFQYRMGTLTEDDWYETQAVLHYWLDRPGGQAWWKKLGRASFGENFREFVDAEIAALNARAKGT